MVPAPMKAMNEERPHRNFACQGLQPTIRVGWYFVLSGVSAPFPFDRVIVDRDNNSTPGPNVEDENLMSALTNSLSFANSEFTFSNNLRLNSLEPLRDISSVTTCSPSFFGIRRSSNP